MNNKGFTLIELIMIILILAMLAVLTTPNVISYINKNKVDNYNSTIESIIEATEIYVSEHRYELTFKNSTGAIDSCTPGEINDIYAYINAGGTLRNIQLGDLIDSKDLQSTTKDATNKETIENSCNKEAINRNTKIKVTLNCTTKQFSYAILYDPSTTNLKNDATITESDGKIKTGEKCSDLYG